MTPSNKREFYFRRINRTALVRIAAPFVLVVVLLTPSIWMLTLIPPLWRDVDAYIQVTQPPGSGTILQYSPLYCFAARLPLYLGYAIECLRAGQPLPGLGFFVHPILTDLGVFLLLLLQHAALCSAAFYLIAVTSGIFWVRFILAIAWAANPLFYSFAHCVGGETLSMILTVLIGATGLKIVRYSRRVPMKDWLLFGMLLWLCILARYINAVLAGLLPLSFFIVVAYRLVTSRCGRSQLLRRWQGLRARQDLGKAILGVAVGFCCVLIAHGSLRGLCYAANTPYHSVVGLAFLGRLKFLAAVPVEKRNELLDKVIRNTDSADVKNFIAVLRNELPTDTPNWDISAFKRKARLLLMSPETDTSDHTFIIVLNRTALAFLYPPNTILLSVVAADFKRSQQITIPNVVSFLFVTTRFYFSHRDAMPQYASLVTFRNKSADDIFGVFKNHSYFHHPKNLTYRALLFFWLVSLVLFAAILKMRRQKAAGVTLYATALTALGLLMMLANCLLAIFQPRYTLPMWELTIVSLVILSGGILDRLFSPSWRQPSMERHELGRY